MTTNDCGPAFPSGIAGPEYGDKAGECMEPGMSLRDFFAAAALTGYRAARCVNIGAYPSETKLWGPAQVAREAYRDADAMLRERNRGADPDTDAK